MDKKSFLEFIDGKNIDIGNDQYISDPYIKIPLIQRDYVEGRKKENKKLEGENFLNIIFDTIQEKELMLDYIYGNIKKEEKGNREIWCFTPLDGQQRLTTLFLLYWYIGRIELEEKECIELMDKLKRFSYETRVSSKDFCMMLCDIGKQDTKDENNIGVKKLIQGKKEFYYDYNLDPTISSMLEILDKIEELYKKNNQYYYEKLENIKFSLLIMNNYGLTDELYIKMNARGKKLTDIENFKADFIEFIHKKNGKENFKFNKSKYNKRDCEYIEKFIWKFDNEWTDYLWENVCGKEKRKIDQYFKRIIYIYFLILYDIRNIDNKTKFIEDDKRIYISDFNDYDTFSFFEELIDNKETLERLERFLDCFLFSYKDIKDYSIPIWDNEYDFCSFNDKDNNESSIPYEKLLNIVAVELYINKSKKIIYNKEKGFFSLNSEVKDNIKDSNFDDFRKWMRVANNIIYNSDVDSDIAYKSCLRVIIKLSDHVDDIYNYLATTNDSYDSSKNQIEEEKLKCKLIIDNTNEEYENRFIDLESNSFLKGQIYFILDNNIKYKVLEKRSKMWEVIFNREYKFEKKSNGRDLLLIKNLILISLQGDTNMEYKIVDFDESEHYLKKALRSNKEYQKLFITMIDKVNENEVKELLKNNIKQVKSELSKMIINNDELIKWTLNNNGKGRYYYKNRDNQFSVGSTRASSQWVSLNTNRFKIQTFLFDESYNCDKRLENTNFVVCENSVFYKDDKEIVLKRDGTIEYKKGDKNFEQIKINYINDEDPVYGFKQWYNKKKKNNGG